MTMSSESFKTGQSTRKIQLFDKQILGLFEYNFMKKFSFFNSLEDAFTNNKRNNILRINTFMKILFAFRNRNNTVFN